MENVLKKRIEERLAVTGKTMSAASEEATGGRETLRKILNGTTKNPRIDTIRKIAEVLGTTHYYLLGDTDFPGIVDTAKTDATATEQPDTTATAASLLPSQTYATDVPVLGTAAGSFVRGAFKIETGIIDFIRRPPALISARDIYALYVIGSSMEPQYFPGDLIFVNPHKPVKNGDVVVVQTQAGEHLKPEATLGILLRQSEKSTIIGKRNPAAEIELNRDTVISIHRVLTINELFGA